MNRQPTTREGLEAALDLFGIGAGIFLLVKRFGVVRAAGGLYALDQLVFRKIRGKSAPRAWDLRLR